MRTLRFPDGTTPVVVSADTAALVRAEASALADYLDRHPGVGPDALSTMLFRVRPMRRYRAVVMAADRADLLAGLRGVAAGTVPRNAVSSARPAAQRRVSMIFPGQGGQHAGMGTLFYRNVPAFAAEVDRVHDAFIEVFGSSPRAYLLGEQAPGAEPAALVQPALFMQMAGLAEMWKSFGVTPASVVGHSQGEIAACYVSGVLDLDVAVRIVGGRARAVDSVESGEYAMAVVEADRNECEALLARRSAWAQVSVVNSPRMTGISGETQAVTEVVEHLADKGRFSRVIAVRYPAHTAVMHRVGEEVSAAIGSSAATAFRRTPIACIGSTLGEEITPDLPSGDYWFWNLRNVVRFDKAIGRAVDLGADVFIELSEHPTLQLPVREILAGLTDRERTVLGTSNRAADDLSVVTRNLATLAVLDAEFDWTALASGADGGTPPPLLDFPHTLTNDTFMWMLPPRTAPAPVRSVPIEVRPSSRVATAVSAPSVPATARVAEQWSRLSRRSMTAPATIGIVDLGAGDGTLAAALIEYAAAFGATARRIDVEQPADQGDLDTVVVLPPHRTPADSAAESARAAVEVAAEFFGDRRWWRSDGPARDYWLVTSGGEAVLDGELADVAQAGIAAGFRCLGAEYPKVGFRHLDLAGDLGDETVDASVATKIIAALHTAREPDVALRGKELYVKRLVPADAVPPVAQPVRHVLIVGGTGKVGMAFAEYFSAGRAEQITLVNRSGETPALTARLAEIRSATTSIDVVACDVTDDEQAARLGERTRELPADLVIHAAADLPQQTGVDLTAITREHVSRLCDAKVVGVHRVLDAITRSEGARVLLCSSLAATLGGRGTTVYTVANRMLDAVANRLRAQGIACSSVEWGQWAVHEGDGVAGAQALAAVGYLPMPSIDAIEAGLAVRGNEIVAAFDWRRGRDVLGAFGYGPLLSELVTSGGPAAAEAAPPPTAPTQPAPVAAATAQPAMSTSQRVVQLVADVIGVGDSDAIDTTRPLVALGLDSLQALELRRKVTEQFGFELPVTELVGGASLDDVVRLLGENAAAAPPAPAAAAAAPTESLAEHARAIADQSVPVLDFERVRSARIDIDRIGLQAMMTALRPAFDAAAERTADDVADLLNFAPRHRWLLRRWLDALVDGGALRFDGARYCAASRVPQPRESDLRAICAELGFRPVLADFLAGCNSNLIPLGQDSMRVQELLFVGGGTDTAEAAYRENMVSRYLNAAASVAVADLVTTIGARRTPVRILELGAGVGGTTNDVVAGLAQLPVALDYHFTDVSEFFLSAAREHFAAYPWMRFGILDMNAGLGDVVRRNDRYDIVIASNVLHNAHHIGETLGRLHDLLNPGGAVVIIESTHAYAQLLTSVQFLMSPAEGQPHAGTGDVRAGERIFLTEDEWVGELRTAGLTPAVVLPRPDHPVALLDQRVFVAIRDEQVGGTND